jgi:hypothetical protein
MGKRAKCERKERKRKNKNKIGTYNGKMHA